MAALASPRPFALRRLFAASKPIELIFAAGGDILRGKRPGP
jgi:hypothetical protein